MKKLLDRSCWLGMLLLMSSCTKDMQTISGPSAALTAAAPLTAANATAAFAAFNENYYNQTAKLYYSTTAKTGIGAIWTQAIYWDMAMNAYKRTQDQAYLTLVNDIYQGGYDKYDGYNWDNATEWFIYDDMMWWVIALTNAYELTNKPVMLQKAKAGFAKVWAGSYDPVKGGMWWDFKHSGKNACINFPTVIAAMKLYAITGEQTYLQKAKEIYEWARTNLVDVSKGRVADHKVGNNPPGFQDYTYNQGTYIGAGVALFKVTGTASYLDDAHKAVLYTKNTMCNADGILPAEGNWNEQGVLKSIFAQYLATVPDVKATYGAWITKNMESAWKNRDQVRGIMYRDYTVPCPAGVVQSYESSSGVAFMQLFISN